MHLLYVHIYVNICIFMLCIFVLTMYLCVNQWYIYIWYIFANIYLYCVYKRTQTSLFSTTCVWVDTADESLPSERTTHTFHTPSSFEHHGKLVRSLNHTVAGIAAHWNCWHLSRISRKTLAREKMQSRCFGVKATINLAADVSCT